jgi:hypothetical protein
VYLLGGEAVVVGQGRIRDRERPLAHRGDHWPEPLAQLGELVLDPGRDLATAYSTHLGRDVVFEAVVPAEFGRNIASVVGEAAAMGVVALYQGLWEAPAHVIDDTTSAQQKLGLTPRTA